MSNVLTLIVPDIGPTVGLLVDNSLVDFGIRHEIVRLFEKHVFVLVPPTSSYFVSHVCL